MKETVAILGASNNPDRYSYKAMKLLEEHGHNTLLIHPSLEEVEGKKVFRTLNEAKEKFGTFDTLTLYVSPSISNKMIDEILDFPVKRIIFNPGTENDKLYKKLTENKIKFEEACTLVLLRTNQY